MQVKQNLLKSEFISFNIIVMLLLILYFNIWNTRDHFTVFGWESEEMSGDINFIRFGLIEFTGDDILDSSSSIEDCFALDKVVVLYHT